MGAIALSAMPIAPKGRSYMKAVSSSYWQERGTASTGASDSQAHAPVTGV